jgi:hypothetical protein
LRERESRSLEESLLKFKKGSFDRFDGVKRLS